jgi:hypothetical protein
MLPELAAAVENAYRVFARYDLRGGVTVCRCNVCVAPEVEQQLNTVPLREISARLLTQYTESAHSFDGKVENDLRHYLPRYFELIANGDPPTNIDEETCLQRLREADYPRNWGPVEASAVDGFLVALLRARLLTPFDIDAMGYTGYGDDGAETVLCMAAYAGADLAPLLAAWQGMAWQETAWDREASRAGEARLATLHLANVIATADWRLKQLHDSWWIHRGTIEPAMQQVIRWLIQASVWERLEAACLSEQQEGAAALLSRAEGVLAGLFWRGLDQSPR